MSAATDAKRMFVENLNSFGNEQTQPEKYNLYLALIYLTASVEQIQQDLEQIKQKSPESGLPLPGRFTPEGIGTKMFTEGVM